ncbi:hypothetical protein RVR_4104 [Actinacidiphila reveromycinica]|uniref:Integral membrane protein n=1 Tax=Actinacidiphila reveromycinica TaxID=659352 RepID=A0A7U3USV1_9ACTN|nr:hypothetical protein [Streptomyces sp. SN-593]BBA98061.1 hypothetical protein RVR_4104 [Streptomyces sp. SN-593]
MIEVLAVIAIVAYVIGRQLLGESLRGKRVLLLPAILVIVGLTRLSGGGHHLHPVDVACLVVSGLVAAAIGAGQGAMMRLENRQGGLWGQMPPRGLVLWVALVGFRVAMTVLAGALGAHVAASSAPIVLLLGVNRLGQAAVITRRALAAGIPFARENDGSVFLSDQLSGLGTRLTGRSGPAAPGRGATSYGPQASSGRPGAYDAPTADRYAPYDAYDAYGRNDPYDRQDAYDRGAYDRGAARDRDRNASYDRAPYGGSPYDRDDAYPGGDRRRGNSDRGHYGAVRRDRAGRRTSRRFQ